MGQLSHSVTMAYQEKKGSQQHRKPPIIMPSVWAALCSLRTLRSDVDLRDDVIDCCRRLCNGSSGRFVLDFKSFLAVENVVRFALWEVSSKELDDFINCTDEVLTKLLYAIPTPSNDADALETGLGVGILTVVSTAAALSIFAVTSLTVAPSSD